MERQLNLKDKSWVWITIINEKTTVISKIIIFLTFVHSLLSFYSAGVLFTRDNLKKMFPLATIVRRVCERQKM